MGMICFMATRCMLCVLIQSQQKGKVHKRLRHGEVIFSISLLEIKIVIFQIPIHTQSVTNFPPETRWEKQLASKDPTIISMVVEDFVLTLEAKESEILGAGLCLWLTCKLLGR